MQPLDPSQLAAIRPETPPAPSSASDQEWDSWAKRGEIGRRQTRLTAALQRDLAAKLSIHKVILTNIRIAGFCLAAVLIIRVLHLIIPGQTGWLDKGQLAEIDTLAKFTISGAVGSLLTRYLNKNVANEEDEDKPKK
jgi:hypothetical protein